MSSLRNVSAIVEKEWRHYFGSPIAYVLLFVWTFLFGRFFQVAFEYFLLASARQGGMEMGMGPKMSLNEWVLRPLFQNMAVVALFVIPMLTMRLFAEEKRQGTIELLSTNPLTDWQIVLGKFFAATGLFGFMILVSLVNFVPLWVYATNPPEWKPVATGVLALLLYGASLIAVGTFISTLTRNQIVAGILSFCAFLALLTLGWADDPAAGPLQQAIAYLSVTAHMEDMTKGVLDLKDVVFYLSFAGFGLFLAQQSVESQRWRA
jgi:ABC-2 type transport system permease protein